jgi:integrase
VLDKCPDAQWRLLFALSRYGGLRCPSEHLALTWQDVDWDQGRIHVTCSKTEHHEGRAERFVPIFPELRPYLLEVFEQAEPGTTHVITRYRDRNANLRTQLQRIMRKAGLTPWPRLFHNLRSTRQTELTEKFPAHVVAAWIGNTERVAQNHYLQVTDAHFAKALAEVGPAEQAAQNPAQSAAVAVGKGEETSSRSNENRSDLPSDSDPSRYLHIEQVAATGLEPVTRGL